MFRFFCLQFPISADQLKQTVSLFSSCAFRLNTRSTYYQHHKTYLALCEQLQFKSHQPLSEEDLSALICFYSFSHKITTLPSFISALAALYEMQKWRLPRGPLFDRTKKGLQNYFAHNNVSCPKDIITMDMLSIFRSKLDLSRFDDARDWCAFLFAFFGLLRISEYTNGNLLLQDIIGNAPADRVRISIPFSKTSNFPVTIDLAARADNLCPRQALAHYLSLISEKVRRTHATPLFLVFPTAFKPLPESTLINRLRHLLKLCFPSLQFMKFAGHSFRRGGASALFAAGVPEAAIQRHGRWKSLTVRDYFDNTATDAERLSISASLRLQPTGASSEYYSLSTEQEAALL